MNSNRMQGLTLVALAATVLGASGCATKGFVRARVGEADAKAMGRISEVEKNTADKMTAMDEKHQTEVSRVGEVAQGADARAGEALRNAATADGKAEQADRKAIESGQRADDARKTAEAAHAKVDALGTLKLVATESVLFSFDSAALTDEETAKLDALAEPAAARFHTVEVHGFTDTVGDKAYNLNLSRRRAEAVVRYLAQKHEIPLHRIQLMGFGPEAVEASEEMKARERNRLSRRVEVRIFAPEQASIRAGTL